MKLPERIKAQIKMRGLTQVEVANKLGVMPTSLSRTILNPRITMVDLTKIADAIGCQVDDFFGDYEKHELKCPYCGKPIKVKLE